MHSCICSVTGVYILADKATYSYICSVTSVCIYSVYKHVAPTFSDINQSTIDLLFCSTHPHTYTASQTRTLNSAACRVDSGPSIQTIIGFTLNPSAMYSRLMQLHLHLALGLLAGARQAQYTIAGGLKVIIVLAVGKISIHSQARDRRRASLTYTRNIASNIS
jgi:hypothetical protein